MPSRKDPLGATAVVLVHNLRRKSWAIGIMAMFFPRSFAVVGDATNTGPSTVQTVTPAPSPTTEPRPTQAPVQ